MVDQNKLISNHKEVKYCAKQEKKQKEKETQSFKIDNNRSINFKSAERIDLNFVDGADEEFGQACEEPNLDSGYAWFILCVMFLISSTTSGTSRVYGLVYARQISTGYYNHEQASWPIATASTVENLTGVLTPAFAQILSWRQIQLLSTFLFICSNLGAYFSDSLLIDILCLGFIQGLALSTGTVLTLAINNDYFDRFRTTAYGIAMSGATCGVFVLCPLIEWVLELYPDNFRPVYLVVAAVLTLNLLLSLFIVPRSTTKAFVRYKTRRENLIKSGKRKTIPNNSSDSNLKRVLELKRSESKTMSIKEEQIIDNNNNKKITRKISRFESHFERKNSLASINIDTRTRRISALARDLSISSFNSKSANKLSSLEGNSSVTGGSGCCSCNCHYAATTRADNRVSAKLDKNFSFLSQKERQQLEESSNEIINKYILSKIDKCGESKIQSTTSSLSPKSSISSSKLQDVVVVGSVDGHKKVGKTNNNNSSMIIAYKTPSFAAIQATNFIDKHDETKLKKNSVGAKSLDSSKFYKTLQNKRSNDNVVADDGWQMLDSDMITFKARKFVESRDDNNEEEEEEKEEEKEVDNREEQVKSEKLNGEEMHRLSFARELLAYSPSSMPASKQSIEIACAEQAARASKHFSNNNDSKQNVNQKHDCVNQAHGEQEELGLYDSLKLLNGPYIHCVWIMLTIYYLVSRVFIIILADFGEDHGLSNSESYKLLDYWSIGELLGRVILASLIDLRWLSVKSCVVFTSALLSIVIGLMASIESFYVYSICSILIAAFISLEYMLINALMVEYLGKNKAIACYSIAALISSVLLFGRPTLIGLFRDRLGSYDGLLILLAIICLTFAILFATLEPLFVRFWPKATTQTTTKSKSII